MKQAQTTYTNEVTYTVDEETLTTRFYDSQGKVMFVCGVNRFPYNVDSVCPYSQYGCKPEKYKNFYKTHGVLPINFFKIMKGVFYQEICLEYPESYKLCRRRTWTNLDRHFVTSTKVEHLLQQCRKDNIANLIPIVAMLGESPESLSKTFPPSIWKLFCKNSYTKNKAIASVISHIGLSYSFMLSGMIEDGLYELVTMPTNFLTLYRNRFNIYNIRAISWALNLTQHPIKHLLDVALRTDFCSKIDLYVDTSRMVNKLNQKHGFSFKFNHSWSLRRMKEEHDKFSKILLEIEMKEKKHLDEIDIRALHKNAIDFTFESGVTATLLSRYSEIVHEGSVMNHCVAMFADSCINGDYLVYSLKKGDTRTTLGIEVSDSPRKYKFSQHYMKYNRVVEDEDFLQAAKQIILELNQECE